MMRRLRSLLPRVNPASGQSMVEFAMILPLFLALVIGIFEFGRAWNIYQVITNAAREAARTSVIDSNTDSDVQDAIDTGLNAAGLDPANATVSIDRSGKATGQPSTIQLSYPYEFLFLGPIVAFIGSDEDDEGMAGTITLSTTAVMRNE